jgi:sugar (pentulose or hexulose) kinase
LIIKKISDRFNCIPDTSKQRFKPEWHDVALQHVDISECHSPEEAYQKSMWLFILELKKSMDLSIGQTGIQRICVDGGFSRNEIFLQSLARAYPELDIYAAAVPQASAIGAAMILEGIWNPEPPALDLVELRYVPGNYPA